MTTHEIQLTTRIFLLLLGTGLFATVWANDPGLQPQNHVVASSPDSPPTDYQQSKNHAETTLIGNERPAYRLCISQPEMNAETAQHSAKHYYQIATHQGLRTNICLNHTLWSELGLPEDLFDQSQFVIATSVNRWYFTRTEPKTAKASVTTSLKH